MARHHGQVVKDRRAKDDDLPGRKKTADVGVGQEPSDQGKVEYNPDVVVDALGVNYDCPQWVVGVGSANLHGDACDAEEDEALRDRHYRSDAPPEEAEGLDAAGRDQHGPHNGRVQDNIRYAKSLQGDGRRPRADEVMPPSSGRPLLCSTLGADAHAGVFPALGAHAPGRGWCRHAGLEVLILRGVGDRGARGQGRRRRGVRAEHGGGRAAAT
mmetsp:Transcript_112078/g.322153  ORF Transcript_112078/g.322153 Transcript_112078/m.322153 type:complete len:213 (+) Transcript_112078:550-1188(+)